MNQFLNSFLNEDMGGLSGVMGKLLGLKVPSVSPGVSMAAATVDSFLPEASEYSGTKREITKGLNTGYYAALGAISAVNPVLGGLMGLGAAGNKLMKAFGAGTDGMTTTDAILGSNFLAPLGWINGMFGAHSKTLVKDKDAFARTGSSYNATSGDVDYGIKFSGKKYGGFSAGARHTANRIMGKVGMLQGMISEIADNTDLNNNLMTNQSSMATNAAAYELSGGYDYTGARAAKYGMKFTINNISRVKNILNPKIELNEEIPIHKEGNKINIRELALPKEISRAIRVAKLGIKIIQPITYDYSNSEITDEMINQLIGVLEFKEGGLLIDNSIEDISKQPNLIPEGALHARKHDIPQTKEEGLTKKGIPVVVEEDGGSLNLLAEIEVNEIIINKQTTDQIEKLYKEYKKENLSLSEKDKLAIEAGKILADSIVNNTDDKTGLMKTI